MNMQKVNCMQIQPSWKHWLLTSFLLCLITSPLQPVWGIQLKNPSGPLKQKCSVCKDIVRNFHEGLKKTSTSNYGGGNTKWEESRLGNYAFSEIRLTEVLEHLCDDEKECHHLLEEHEELVETFWFKEFAKGKDTDFFQWLCIDNVKVCCQNNTYGPNCETCTGGTHRPCKDNGHCDGEGTREGTGKCQCYLGYKGDLCDECTDGYYEASGNETHITCDNCDRSCKFTCTEGGPKGCDKCKKGYRDADELGCQDIDECEREGSICGTNFYCTNSPGSFTCIKCDMACQTCTESGPDYCLECRSGYNMEDNTCKDIDECGAEEPVCMVENEKCVNNGGGYTCICDIGYERVGDICMLRPKQAKDEDVVDDPVEGTDDDVEGTDGEDGKIKEEL